MLTCFFPHSSITMPAASPPATLVDMTEAEGASSDPTALTPVTSSSISYSLADDEADTAALQSSSALLSHPAFTIIKHSRAANSLIAKLRHSSSASHRAHLCSALGSHYFVLQQYDAALPFYRLDRRLSAQAGMGVLDVLLPLRREGECLHAMGEHEQAVVVLQRCVRMLEEERAAGAAAAGGSRALERRKREQAMQELQVCLGNAYLEWSDDPCMQAKDSRARVVQSQQHYLKAMTLAKRLAHVDAGDATAGSSAAVLRKGEAVVLVNSLVNLANALVQLLYFDNLELAARQGLPEAAASVAVSDAFDPVTSPSDDISSLPTGVLLSHKHSRFQSALDLYDAALALSTGHSLTATLIRTHHNLGTLYEKMTQWAPALHHLRCAVEAAMSEDRSMRRDERSREELSSRSVLVHMLMRAGQYERAAKEAAQAVHRARAIGQPAEQEEAARDRVIADDVEARVRAIAIVQEQTTNLEQRIAQLQLKVKAEQEWEEDGQQAAESSAEAVSLLTEYAARQHQLSALHVANARVLVQVEDSFRQAVEAEQRAIDCQRTQLAALRRSITDSSRRRRRVNSASDAVRDRELLHLDDEEREQRPETNAKTEEMIVEQGEAEDDAALLSEPSIPAPVRAAYSSLAASLSRSYAHCGFARNLHLQHIISVKSDPAQLKRGVAVTLDCFSQAARTAAGLKDRLLSAYMLLRKAQVQWNSDEGSEQVLSTLWAALQEARDAGEEGGGRGVAVLEQRLLDWLQYVLEDGETRGVKDEIARQRLKVAVEEAEQRRRRPRARAATEEDEEAVASLDREFADQQVAAQSEESEEEEEGGGAEDNGDEEAGNASQSPSQSPPPRSKQSSRRSRSTAAAGRRPTAAAAARNALHDSRRTGLAASQPASKPQHRAAERLENGQREQEDDDRPPHSEDEQTEESESSDDDVAIISSTLPSPARSAHLPRSSLSATQPQPQTRAAHSPPPVPVSSHYDTDDADDDDARLEGEREPGVVHRPVRRDSRSPRRPHSRPSHHSSARRQRRRSLGGKRERSAGSSQQEEKREREDDSSWIVEDRVGSSRRSRRGSADAASPSQRGRDAAGASPALPSRRSSRARNPAMQAMLRHQMHCLLQDRRRSDENSRRQQQQRSEDGQQLPLSPSSLMQQDDDGSEEQPDGLCASPTGHRDRHSRSQSFSLQDGNDSDSSMQLDSVDAGGRQEAAQRLRRSRSPRLNPDVAPSHPSALSSPPALAAPRPRSVLRVIVEGATYPLRLTDGDRAWLSDEELSAITVQHLMERLCLLLLHQTGRPCVLLHLLQAGEPLPSSETALSIFSRGSGEDPPLLSAVVESWKAVSMLDCYRTLCASHAPPLLSHPLVEQQLQEARTALTSHISFTEPSSTLTAARLLPLFLALRAESGTLRSLCLPPACLLHSDCIDALTETICYTQAASCFASVRIALLQRFPLLPMPAPPAVATQSLALQGLSAVSLRSTLISSASLSPLLHAMAALPALEELDLSMSLLDDDCLPALSFLLRHSSSISSLCLRRTLLRGEQRLFLSDFTSALSVSKTMTALDLSETDWCADGLLVVLPALSRLSTLSLAFIPVLRDPSASFLDPSLPFAALSRTLQSPSCAVVSLDLSGCSDDGDELGLLLESLLSSPSCPLQNLSLRFCSLSSLSFRRLLRAIGESNSSLKTLALDGSQGLEGEGGDELLYLLLLSRSPPNKQGKERTAGEVLCQLSELSLRHCSSLGCKQHKALQLMRNRGLVSCKLIL